MSRNSVRQGFVRATAEKVLKDHGVNGPEVPIDDVVRSHGLSIQEGKVPQGWGFFHVSSWSIRLSPTLFRETPQNRNRRRFTLAHELGHCLLEHGETSCWNLSAVSEPTEIAALEDLPNFEQEAHQFARELLLPRDWLAKDWESGLEVGVLASRYGVSKETLFIVLMERNLLMQRRKRR